MNGLKALWSTPERRITIALLLFCGLLYIPFAGNYGGWDPWETHYSEVARQMLMRHDYVSLYWPGSPQDRNEFWSKPVLTFWLMAMGFAVTGMERLGHAFDGEMAVGWLAEWSVRIPFILCAIACVWAVWELVQRLAGRRAGMWSAILLATSSQFFFVARQAMTDMAFVAPIAVALCFAGLGLLLPASEVEAELPRRSGTVGPFKLSWPHAKVYYATTGLILLVVVPQLLLMSIQLHLALPVGKRVLKMAGVVPMLPWIACFVVYLLGAMRARCKRQLYLHVSFLMGGVSTLAKGPAGLALPLLVVVGYLIAQGEYASLLPRKGWWSDYRAMFRSAPIVSRIWNGVLFVWHLLKGHKLELLLGTLLFVACAFPWYHGMLIRHGMGFWNEFIGDNYVHRAAGRHGDRGTFEYYILQVGHGMFPWIGVVAAALLASLTRLGKGDGRAKLRGYALIWFVVMFGVMSLVNTKFHHYILPALPALAILGGLFLDDLFTQPKMADAVALLVAGLPIVALVARDLALFPARLTWLFDYDYVNAPNGGRPWPTEAAYDYSTRIGWFGLVVTSGTALLAIVTLLRVWMAAPKKLDAATAAAVGAAESEADGATAAAGAATNRQADAADDADSSLPLPGWFALPLLALPIVTVILAERMQPAFTDGPHPLANGWILVGGMAAVFLALLIGSGLRSSSRWHATLTLLVTGSIACLWTAWCLDRHLTDLSPHWSQKHVIASYYLQRHQDPSSTALTPDEPLVAWNMYWRGETFYSKNQIYDHRIDQKDKTVFLGDHNAEKLQEYFKTHAGRRMFFIVERSRFESLRALLPEPARPSFHAVDETNNKVYLAVAQL